MSVLCDDSPAVGPVGLWLVVASPTGVWRAWRVFGPGPGREREDETPTPEGPDFDKPRARARVMGAGKSSVLVAAFFCGGREDVSVMADAGRFTAVPATGSGKRGGSEGGICPF